MQPGSLPYHSGSTMEDYIQLAGGYNDTSDSSNTFATSYALNDLNTAPACLVMPGAAGDTTGHHLD